MHVSNSRLFLLGAVLLWLLPSTTYADPIRVTSGSTIVYGSNEPSSASLVGDGLSLIGDGFGGGGSTFATIGTLTTIDGRFVFDSPNVFGVIVNGTSYSAILRGTLDFLTRPFIAPAPDANGTGHFQTTFAMTGRVRGFRTGAAGPPLFDVELQGSGDATGHAAFLGGTYNGLTGGGTYNFAAASATPEPASMLLLGTGIAGLFLRTRNRRVEP
jgi:hypothetical protein